MNTQDNEWTPITTWEWTVRESGFYGHHFKPVLFKDPAGVTTLVSAWTDLLVETAEWLIRNRLLTKADCPIATSGMRDRFLIASSPQHPSGRNWTQFKELSNGLFIDTQHDVHHVFVHCIELLTCFGQRPSRFQVSYQMLI